jgi:hypothetical protein
MQGIGGHGAAFQVQVFNASSVALSSLPSPLASAASDSRVIRGEMAGVAINRTDMRAADLRAAKRSADACQAYSVH